MSIASDELWLHLPTSWWHLVISCYYNRSPGNQDQFPWRNSCFGRVGSVPLCLAEVSPHTPPSTWYFPTRSWQPLWLTLHIRNCIVKMLLWCVSLRNLRDIWPIWYESLSWEFWCINEKVSTSIIKLFSSLFSKVAISDASPSTYIIKHGCAWGHSQNPGTECSVLCKWLLLSLPISAPASYH